MHSENSIVVFNQMPSLPGLRYFFFLVFHHISLALNFLLFASYGLVTAHQLCDKQLEGKESVLLIFISFRAKPVNKQLAVAKRIL